MRSRRLLLLLVAGVLVVAGSVIGFSFRSHSGTAAPETEEHEPLVYHGTTACGVERWHVKTGIDADARKVNQSTVASTTISHLRSLPAPSFLPVNNRLGPTELTVFRVSGYLLRVKTEADSDYHLVLADSGGRTMIVESPAPACVGASSPFLSHIRGVRALLTSRFHPTAGGWDRGHWPIQVTGVGFFDFKHGQSGVAPNAIELHPLLSVKLGGAVSTSPPTTQATPNPAPTGSFSVSAAVTPNPVHYGQYASLTGKSVVGAKCSALVVYSTGRRPVSFNGSTQTAGSNGTVSWSWHMESKGTGGTGTVTCSYHGATRAATASFTIV
jgi:hypothetical protein